jgi:fructose-1,6-bisphosphatase
MKFTVTKKQEVTQEIELCEYMKKDTTFFRFDFENSTVTRIKLFQFKECGIFPGIDKDTIDFYSKTNSLDDLQPSTLKEWGEALEQVLDILNVV